MDKPFWLKGKMPDRGTIWRHGDTVTELEEWARQFHLVSWAIFRREEGLLEGSREVLMRHHDDPYWSAQGIPSDCDVEPVLSSLAS